MRLVDFTPLSSHNPRDTSPGDVCFLRDVVSFAKLGTPTLTKKPEGSSLEAGVENAIDAPGFYAFRIGETTYKLYCAPEGIENHDRYIRRDGTSSAHYVLRELFREFGETGLNWSKLSATGNPWPCRHNPNGPPLSLENYGLPPFHNSLASNNNR